MTAPNLHVPSKPINKGAASTGSQRDRRFTDTFFDDYRHPRFPNGRPFTGQREFQSGSSTESIAAGFLQSDLQPGQYFCDNPDMGQTPEERRLTLESAWTPVWLPLAKYWRFNYRNKRITYALNIMIADEKTALARFWEAAAKAAGENDVIDPSRPLAVPYRIRTLIGNPVTYLNNIKIAQAAQAGDPWLMGAVTTPNEELAKILSVGTIQYLGAPVDSGDAQYVAVAPAAAPKPLMTPEQVLSVPMDQVASMIADALAKHEADKKAAHAAKSKAGKLAKAGKAA